MFRRRRWDAPIGLGGGWGLSVPGYQGENHLAGVGEGANVDAAPEVFVEGHEGVQAEAGLAYAGRKHYAHTGEAGLKVAFVAGGFVEFVAEFEGQVAQAEGFEEGLEAAIMGVCPALEAV